MSPSTLHTTTRTEVRLVGYPTGIPDPGDFALAHVEIPALREGQILVRNMFMSVDPSMRIRMNPTAGTGSYLAPYELDSPLEGWAVGEVVESRHSGFAPGDHVTHFKGWRDLDVLDPGSRGYRDPLKVTVDDAIPASSYLNSLGVSGLTAWSGICCLAEVRRGDVVFVSGAGGSVGSLAVQIAKIMGATVIASAGSAEKVAFSTTALGADAAFCYRDGPVAELLRDAAPSGVDVYFDNVGGDHLVAALDEMNIDGRIVMCGAISGYSTPGSPTPGPRNLFNITSRSLSVRGFLARNFAHRFDEFRAQMIEWRSRGLILERETVVEGIENAPSAFIDMLSGANTGKMMVDLR
ncbi:zinc-binding dehydrogenase [Gordonia jinghuaiqii]|uniref:NADP-dependent oxidoreductase n=2 Tax=Gordonia jinghuaiqii TaxID=2758710 RepID=A0A7D7QKJ3_9ACTN|nr:zinc-binding dehydrogenase [Gordonia jinghuaiqii]QMT04084.1 NADP-dependent oxidoreductase [Gordonia jinghuaiqii]